MSCDFILYKKPIQYDTLYIVQYLDYLGISLRPLYCIERNHPNWVSQLPSIYIPATNERYIGLADCVAFFEQKSGVSNILEAATEFKKIHPEYRIRANQ